jgi:hypothetical protein
MKRGNPAVHRRKPVYDDIARALTGGQLDCFVVLPPLILLAMT